MISEMALLSNHVRNWQNSTVFSLNYNLSGVGREERMRSRLASSGPQVLSGDDDAPAEGQLGDVLEMVLPGTLLGAGRALLRSEGRDQGCWCTERSCIMKHYLTA